MKTLISKYLLPLIALLIVTEAPGQAYIPFPTDNSVKWFYLRDSHGPTSPNCCYTYFTQTLLGDTIIGGDSFSKLYDTEFTVSQYALLPSIGQTTSLPPTSAFTYQMDTVFEAFISEDSNKRVIFYTQLNPPTLQGPYNAFDFSFLPGDTLTVGEIPVVFTVGTIDSVQTVTEYRSRQFEQTDPNNYWIEGIGSVYYFPNQNTPFEGSCTLIGFMRNDTCIWGNCPWMDYSLTSINEPLPAQMIQVFPNPAEDILQVNLQNNNWNTLTLFSTDGKLACSFDLSGKFSTRVDITAFDSGFYFYTVESKDGTRAIGKIVIR